MTTDRLERIAAADCAEHGHHDPDHTGICILCNAILGEPVRDMTLFSARNLARCESPRGFNHQIYSWSLSDWFTATMGELGEAANVAKKLNRVRDGIRGNKETEQALRDKLRKELGDVFCYLDLMATSLGFNIFDAAKEVYEAKSKEIGYEER